MSHAAPPNAAAPELSRGLLWLMAVACGVSVANLIYNQPLLGDFARDFRATPDAVGWVPGVAQIGYGVGLLFLLPLGDLVDRRRLVVLLTGATAVLMGLTGAAENLTWLVLLHGFVGVTSMSAQILIPMAVEMSSPAKRGQTVGMLMTGLLAGILLARTVSGYVAHVAGWRSVYWSAAVIMTLLACALYRGLPQLPKSASMRYGELMRSLLSLTRAHPGLRRATYVSALSFAGFSAFWTTISFLMHDHFGRGSAEAGLFGVVGLIGALGAPLAGKIADKRGPAFIIGLGLGVSVLSFVIMGVWVTIPALILGVLLMDLGAQSVQVAEQAKVIALVPAARSRLNALFMVGRFVGGAAGSLAGGVAWTQFGWTGVCGLATALTVLGWVIHRLSLRYDPPVSAKEVASEGLLRAEALQEDRAR